MYCQVSLSHLREMDRRREEYFQRFYFHIFPKAQNSQIDLNENVFKMYFPETSQTQTHHTYRQKQEVITVHEQSQNRRATTPKVWHRPPPVAALTVFLRSSSGLPQASLRPRMSTQFDLNRKCTVQQTRTNLLLDRTEGRLGTCRYEVTLCFRFVFLMRDDIQSVQI